MTGLVQEANRGPDHHGMRVPKVSFSNIKTILIIFLSVGVASMFMVHADNPSPVGWNLSGGGFCQGNYTLFNTTLSPNPGIYAMNCQTGKNDFYNATDVGFLVNKVRANLESQGIGGEIHLRGGFYSEVTTMIFATCKNSGLGGQGLCETDRILSGSGPGGFSSIVSSAPLNGTVFVAKTNGMTMLEATASSPSVTCNAAGCTGGPTVRGNVVRDLGFNANGLASVGVDFRMTETATINRFIDIAFSGGKLFSNNQKFATAMFLDGNEDTVCDICVFNGDGGLGGADGSATLDLQWETPLGNIEISHSFFGGITNLLVWSQIISVSESTVSSIKIAGTCSACGQLLTVSGSYLANQQGTGLIQLNGQTMNLVRLAGDTITVTSTIPLFSGTGTVYNSMFSANVWAFLTNCNWNAGGATLTHQATDTGNNARVASGPGANGACTNFPFAIAGANASGNF